jgi:hypothetical protein
MVSTNFMKNILKFWDWFLETRKGVSFYAKPGWFISGINSILLNQLECNYIGQIFDLLPFRLNSSLAIILELMFCAMLESIRHRIILIKFKRTFVRMGSNHYKSWTGFPCICGKKPTPFSRSFSNQFYSSFLGSQFYSVNFPSTIFIKQFHNCEIEVTQSILKAQ